jgi:hypothetical protein
MNASLLQAKVYAGYAQVAKRLGMDHQVFRPEQAEDPFTQPITTLKVSLTAENFSYGQAAKHGQINEIGLFDGQATQAGDYLVHEERCWFIASQALQRPILCIACQDRVRIYRPQPPQAVGALPYQGRTAANEQVILGGRQPWPASLLLGSRQANGIKLPASAKAAGWVVLLPPSIPEAIQASDMLVDQRGQRYLIQASESSALGWRLYVEAAHL